MAMDRDRDGLDEDSISQVSETIRALKDIEEDEGKWTLSTRSASTWLHWLGYAYREI